MKNYLVKLNVFRTIVAENEEDVKEKVMSTIWGVDGLTIVGEEEVGDDYTDEDEDDQSSSFNLNVRLVLDGRENVFK